jgi:hypothetical protein
MGFLDKAKQLAEQAQQKLDEAQQNFNQSGSPQAQPEPDTVRYDEHGRPIQEASPATPAPAGAAEPEPTRQPEIPDRGGGQANASPDPFKPLQQ